jgi:hypothetical protein
MREIPAFGIEGVTYDPDRAEKGRIRVRLWKLANPERARAAMVAYREKNAEELREYNKKYNASRKKRSRQVIKKPKPLVPIWPFIPSALL